MDPSIPILIAIGAQTVALLAAVITNNSRLTDLRTYMDQRFAHIDKRFDAQERLFMERILRLEQVMDARLSHLEQDRKR
jgi:hypothetical protein